MSKIPTDKRLRALEADALLNNALLKEAFNATEQGIIVEIKQGDMLNDNLNVKLMLSLQMLQAIQDRLLGHIADAEYEANPIGEI
jgi:hypothetical protein